ncbi:MAG: flavoprotein [Candidatus Aadella gelida]|nr:flavoprotein [Candidatus Aadella gelida]
MGKTILLGVTGSIAAFKACDLIGMFRKKGYTVKCVMSQDAKWFITPLTLETLTGEKVAKDMFELPEKRTPEHIALADEADIILIAPATADVMGKIAGGMCPDILTCTVLASDKPVVFAPAMNDKMFKNAMVRENIEKLKKNGYHFIDPVKGRLACGKEGIGHLAPLETVVSETEIILKKRG